MSAACFALHQLRLVAFAASAVFRIVYVKQPTPPALCAGGVGIELKSGTVLSCQDLVVQDAFAVGLDLPCSEAGMAVDHPEHCSYKLRPSHSAD